MDSYRLKELILFCIIALTITIIIFYDISNFRGYVYVNEAEEQPYPNVSGVEKIDVGQGEDQWVLTNEKKLYHWNPSERTFLYKRDYVRDFAVGSDGTIAYVDEYLNVQIRDSRKAWQIIYDYGSQNYYRISKISLCDYNIIYLVDTYNNLIKGVYDSKLDKYSWNIIQGSINQGSINQVSCAFHDQSLWIIDEDYVYLYINKFKKILRSETRFRYIKALSVQRAIGIDYDYALWEYTNGTWTLVRSKVKSASINFSDDIYYVDSNNFIYKIPKKIE